MDRVLFFDAADQALELFDQGCSRGFAETPGRVGVPPAGSGVSPERSPVSARQSRDARCIALAGRMPHPTWDDGIFVAGCQRSGRLMIHRGKTPACSDRSRWARLSSENPPCLLRTSIDQRICRTKTYVGVGEQRILNQSGKIRRFSFTRNTGVGDKNARNESSVFTSNHNPRERRKNTYTDEDVKTYDTISHKEACPFAKNFNNQRSSTVNQQNKI